MKFLNKKLQVVLLILILIFFNLFIFFTLFKSSYANIISWGSLFLMSVILLSTQIYEFYKTEKENRKLINVILFAIMFAIASFKVITLI